MSNSREGTPPPTRAALLLYIVKVTSVKFHLFCLGHQANISKYLCLVKRVKQETSSQEAIPLRRLWDPEEVKSFRARLAASYPWLPGKSQESFETDKFFLFPWSRTVLKQFQRKERKSTCSLESEAWFINPVGETKKKKKQMAVVDPNLHVASSQDSVALQTKPANQERKSHSQT